MISVISLLGAVLFILALRGLASPKTAQMGNLFGVVGMALAVMIAFTHPAIESFIPAILAITMGGALGYLVSSRIEMTALPQLVAAFHSLVGLSAVFVAMAVFAAPVAFGISQGDAINSASLIEMSLGTAIGAITFSGSLVAFAKLQGIKLKIALQNIHRINLVLGGVLSLFILLFISSGSVAFFLGIIVISTLLGFTLILPIGGADMPVIVSMLNSYSGWAAAGIGFTLNHNLLIITGALVGASGAILSYIMCKGMNRSIVNVILGGFGSEAQSAGKKDSDENKQVRAGSAEDAGFLMHNASSVIIVPGYGMAVAQAQHSLKEMADILKKNDIRVRYAIHPVAGRMPGHMNVLLAEASVPYEDVFELEDINQEFSTTDVVYVIGANDVTNPSAKTDPSSPIYGMPVLDVEKAKTVIFVKRSMAAGYAGVDNPLFYSQNTLMLFGDAKAVTEQIVKSLHDM